tara:strand:- start:1 stop:216 length:216 start_codon:yes stop_codon:yes gene_type:complete
LTCHNDNHIITVRLSFCQAKKTREKKMYAFIYEIHLVMATAKPVLQNLAISASILGIMLYWIWESNNGKRK